MMQLLLLLLKLPLKANKKLQCTFPGTLIPTARACKGRFRDLTYMLYLLHTDEVCCLETHRTGNMQGLDILVGF